MTNRFIGKWDISSHAVKIFGPLPVLASDPEKKTIDVPNVWECNNWKLAIKEFGTNSTPCDTLKFANTDPYGFTEEWQDADEIYAAVRRGGGPLFVYIHMRNRRILKVARTMWF